MTDEENTEEKVELTPAEDSTWGKFLLKSIELDGKKYPRGWHWFCAFKYLSDVDLTLVQEKLPNEHPFKSGNVHDFFEVTKLKRLVKWLKKQLKIEKIENIDFSELIFKNADFANFIFPVKVSFEGAHFYEEVDFRYAFFLDAVNFYGTVFNKSALFVWAIFNAVSSFNRAVFGFVAVFTGVKFVGSANFAVAKFNNAVDFSDAIFFDEAFFDSIKTESHTDFFNTSFKKYPPSIHNAVIYSGINWDRDINLWPHAPNRKDSKTDEEYKYMLRIIQNAYENLAAHMKKMDKYHDEHFFYRQEMRCRRWQASYPTKCFYWLYETLSDYGYGIERALWGWFGHILAGIYFLIIIIGKSIDSGNKALEPATAFWCSIPTSFSNAHRVLSFHNGALSDCHDYLKSLYLFDVIWAFQSILGILFLFLIVLTVRIRFRLK